MIELRPHYFGTTHDAYRVELVVYKDQTMEMVMTSHLTRKEALELHCELTEILGLAVNPYDRRDD